jgi:mannose-6-phosphate isomerase-like protein (cupin superfamily)
VEEVSPQGFRIARDEDRLGETHGVGIGRLTFKVVTEDSQGGLLVIELVHQDPGGPPRHVHHSQDEWFFVLEGTYVVAIGDKQFELHPGDSAFGPRGVPHTWAYIGDKPGRIVLTISPAGRMEAFLRTLARANTLAPQDPAFWPPYGLELAGPPIALPGHSGTP